MVKLEMSPRYRFWLEFLNLRMGDYILFHARPSPLLTRISQYRPYSHGYRSRPLNTWALWAKSQLQTLENRGKRDHNECFGRLLGHFKQNEANRMPEVLDGQAVLPLRPHSDARLSTCCLESSVVLGADLALEARFRCFKSPGTPFYRQPRCVSHVSLRICLQTFGLAACLTSFLLAFDSRSCNASKSWYLAARPSKRRRSTFKSTQS